MTQGLPIWRDPNRLLLILWGLLAAASVGAQQACPPGIPQSTPTADFTYYGNGTVTHEPAGLMWKRCLEGMNGEDCTIGTATLHTWQAALQFADVHSFAGYEDWRLPNIKELMSIVELSCSNPAINLSVFPNDPGSSVWSGSPVLDTSTGARYVHFHAGYGYWGTDGFGNRDKTFRVRLVRNALKGFVDWTSINQSNRIASGMLGLTAVTFLWTPEGSIGATWFDLSLTSFNTIAFTPSLEFADGLEFTGRKLPETTPTYTITFAAPVTNPLLHIASNASTLTFIGSTPTRVSGDERLSVVGNQVIGSDYNSPSNTDANGTVMFSGTFTSLTFTAQYSGPGSIDGITLQVGTP